MRRVNYALIFLATAILGFGAMVKCQPPCRNVVSLNLSRL